MNYEGFETLIAAIGTGDKNTALEIRNIFTQVIKSIFMPGFIVMVYCTEEEIATLFDSTGLGTGKFIGWRICNGLHDTPPMGGRVPVGYGDSYPEIGATGGSKDAVVVAHSHTQGSESLYNLHGGGVSVGGRTFPAGAIQAYTNQNTSSTGVSGLDKNMQPYTVLLYLMKTEEE